MATLQDRLAKVLAPRYTLENEIASGGMGVVFLGLDTTLQRSIAIKVLRPEIATANMASRFVREARLLAKLSHPNIVGIHDADVADGLYYYVMDYIDGETLEHRLSRGPVSQDEALHIGRELLSALQAVHSVNVIHRDIKPANIFLLDHRVLLADFGIAQDSTTEGTALTKDGEVPMTPRYAAPEQRGGADVTARTDLYSVGLVLYECCTGQNWDQEDDSDDGDWISVPRPLDTALKKALKRRPGDRYADAREFQAALDPKSSVAPRRVLVGLGIAATVAVILSFVICWNTGVCRPGDASAAEINLVIPPFDVSGAPENLGAEMADYVMRRLDPIPLLSVSSAAIGPPVNTTVRHIRGTLAREGDRWILTITLAGLSGNSPARPFVTTDSLPYVLADSVAVEIVRLYFEEFRGRMPSDDLVALGSWFEGEIAFQKDLWKEAEDHFSEAIRRDPEFYLAEWRRLNARAWRRLPINTSNLARAFREGPGTFSPLDQILIEAFLTPNLENRLDLYDEAAKAYPRDYYAALRQSNELFHRGALTGRPLDEALGAFERTQKIDPQLAPAYNQVLWANIRLGNEERSRQTLERYKAIPRQISTEDIDALRMLEWTFYERFYPDTAAMYREVMLTNLDGPIIDEISQVLRLATSLDIPNTQIGLGRFLATEQFGPSTEANGHLAMGLALIMVGRPIAGLSQLDQGPSIYNDPSLLAQEARLLLPMFGVPIDEAEKEVAREKLAQMDRDPKFGARPAWALALDAMTRVDSEAYQTYRSKLLAADPRDSLQWSLAVVMGTLELANGGKVREALLESERLLAYDSAGRGVDPFARALLYWSRAEWFESLDLWIQAEREWLWYENLDFGAWPDGNVQAGEIDWMLGTYARLERAEAQLLLGRTADACVHLARIRELWAEAEPAMERHRQRADSLFAAECPP